jgi:hypothetical protein
MVQTIMQLYNHVVGSQSSDSAGEVSCAPVETFSDVDDSEIQDRQIERRDNRGEGCGWKVN